MNLFCGILIAFLRSECFKQLNTDKGERSGPVTPLLSQGLPLPREIMANQYTVRQYSRQQSLNFSSLPRKVLRVDKEVLYTLNQHGILKYRDKRGGGPRGRNRDTNQGVHWKNLKRIKFDKTLNLSNRGNTLKLSTANTRSIRSKSSEVTQHIFEEKIDICVITETWLQTDGDSHIRGELTQDGYSLDDVPRLNRQGGGIALLYRDNIKVTRSTSTVFQSFECAEWRLSFNNFVSYVIGIYRPPYSEKHPVILAKFITEFTQLLESIVLKTEPVIIMGDFNIHLDNVTDCYSKQFNQCLQSFGLIQHVVNPTHVSGHTLDLIISRKGDKTDISEPVTDYFISDHSFVTCSIQQVRPPLDVKTITTRDWKSVCVESLKSDFASLSKLSGCTTDADELVSKFESSVTEIINKHAPQKEKRIVCRPNVPWYASDLKHLKQYKMCIEKIHLKHRTDIQREHTNMSGIGTLQL